MRLVKWEGLPPIMQNESVRAYYEALQKKKTGLFLKRVFDLSVSFILLLLLSPVFLVLSVMIALDSRGGVFFRQTRVTQYGETFRIHKFRTMVPQAEQMGAQVTVSGDMRITRMGRMIRACRLDELPQLLDVLSGNMTFVGTRPEVPKYVSCYTDEMKATLLLPAGITSEASILYRDESKLLNAAEDLDEVYVTKVMPGKMAYNLQALRDFGFWHDIRTLIRTILAVLGKKYSHPEPEEKEKAEIEL